jgi:pyrroloquinoline quinone (PQQ) biosynthesis protein C
LWYQGPGILWPVIGGEERVSNGTERYFFVHLQKTAGTTMRQRLSHYFGEHAIYPNGSDGKNVYQVVVSIDHLLERMAVRGHEVRVIAGHFPVCTAELLGGGFRSFTVLREPVERTLSYLRHHRQQTAEDRHKTLEEIYDDPFRFHGLAHNHMTKMFSLTLDEMTAGMLTRVEFTEERVQRAKANLASLDLVGVQERFQEFCDELNEHFGWSLGHQPKWANRTEQVEVSDAFRERIIADHAADLELYEFALQLVEERRARATGEGDHARRHETELRAPGQPHDNPTVAADDGRSGAAV